MSGNYANIGQLVPEVGSLDQRITIQNLTTTRSATGAEVVAWADWRTVWARVEVPRTGNDERMMTDQEMAIKRAVFTIRWTGQVKEKWRILYTENSDVDTYDIMVVNNVGRQKFEQILAEVRK